MTLCTDGAGRGTVPNPPNGVRKRPTSIPRTSESSLERGSRLRDCALDSANDSGRADGAEWFADHGGAQFVRLPDECVPFGCELTPRDEEGRPGPFAPLHDCEEAAVRRHTGCVGQASPVSEGFGERPRSLLQARRISLCSNRLTLHLRNTSLGLSLPALGDAQAVSRSHTEALRVPLRILRRCLDSPLCLDQLRTGGFDLFSPRLEVAQRLVAEAGKPFAERDHVERMQAQELVLPRETLERCQRPGELGVGELELAKRVENALAIGHYDGVTRKASKTESTLRSAYKRPGSALMPPPSATYKFLAICSSTCPPYSTMFAPCSANVRATSSRRRGRSHETTAI